MTIQQELLICDCNLTEYNIKVLKKITNYLEKMNKIK